MARPAALSTGRDRDAPSNGAYWEWNGHDWTLGEFGEQSRPFDPNQRRQTRKFTAGVDLLAGSPTEESHDVHSWEEVKQGHEQRLDTCY